MEVPTVPIRSASGRIRWVWRGVFTWVEVNTSDMDLVSSIKDDLY